MNQPNKNLFILLLFLFSINHTGCLHAKSQEVAPSVSIIKEHDDLTWLGVVKMALDRHPDLAAARARLRSKGYDRNIALGEMLPSANASFGRDRLRTTNTLPTRDAMEFDIVAEQTLFSGFGNLSNFLQAKRELDAEEWAYQATSAEVRFQLRSAFVELMRTYDLFSVLKEIAERRKNNAEFIRLRYEAGRENKGAMLRARAISEEADFDMRQTERQIETRSLQLGRHLGGNFWLPVRIAEKLEKEAMITIEKPADYVVLAEKIPIVQQQMKLAQAAKAGIGSAQSVIWPQVTSAYGYGYSGRSASNLRDESTLSLNMSVPLFEGGQNVSGTLGAHADYRAAAEAARSIRDQAIADLSEAWSSVQDTLELIKVRRAFLEAARERADIVRAQYASGLVNFQDFDISEQELADSERAYVDSLADTLIQEANWAAVRGLTLEEILPSKR